MVFPVETNARIQIDGVEPCLPIFNAGMLLIDIENWTDLGCDNMVEKVLLENANVPDIS